MVMKSYAHANPFAFAPCTKPSAVASSFARGTIVADPQASLASDFKT
jgi:hypothetical protein